MVYLTCHEAAYFNRKTGVACSVCHRSLRALLRRSVGENKEDTYFPYKNLG